MTIQGNQVLTNIIYLNQTPYSVNRLGDFDAYDHITGVVDDCDCEECEECPSGCHQFSGFATSGLSGIPIVQITCGGSSVSAEVGPGYNLYATGGYRVAADITAPQISGRWRRIMLKNPGGWHFRPSPYDDAYKMYIDQWTLAKASGWAYAVDEDLQYYHDKMVNDAGILEIIVYIGYPGTITLDPSLDVLEYSRASVQPFLDMGERVSIAFDAGTFLYGDSNDYFPFPNATLAQSLLLFDEIRNAGHKVYIESRPLSGALGWYGHIDGSLSLQQTDVTQVDRMYQAPLYGETIRITQDNTHDTLTGTGGADKGVSGWLPFITPMMRWREGGARDTWDEFDVPTGTATGY